MKATVTHIKEKSQAEIVVSIPAPEFTPYVEKAARSISKELKLPGFRPGKAPVHVVSEAVGQERVLQEALDLAVPHFFVEAALDENVEAITRPNISIKKAGLESELEFTATTDVMPTVTLGDPTTLDIAKKEITVTDEQIDQELTYLAKMRAKPLDVARPAQEGDTAVVDFSISIGGLAIEGGESKSHPITLGEGRFLPAFEKGITGISAGDTREFSLTFPDDYPKTDLRGKEAQARVTAHKVQKHVLPDINDEFARSLGQFANLEELKAKLRENMQKELSQKEVDRYLGELAEKFAEMTTFGHIPPSLIERDIDGRLHEFAHMLAYQSKTLEQYLQQENKTLEQMRDGMREAAEKNVKIGLTLRAFAKQHDIQLEDAEIEQEMIAALAQYGSPEEAEKNVNKDQLRESVINVLRNRKTLEKLAELAGSNRSA